jgi:hypothetical protein
VKTGSIKSTVLIENGQTQMPKKMSETKNLAENVIFFFSFRGQSNISFRSSKVTFTLAITLNIKSIATT